MPNTRGVWLSVVCILGAIVLAFIGVTPGGLSRMRVELEGLVALLPQSALVASSSIATSPHTHPLLSVVDGDTIHALHTTDDVTVRMIGIDAPETGKGNRPRECFGDEATEHLKELLGGNPVSLVPDPTQGLYDKYGRALMYVEQNGVDINAQMIADGYAYEYTYDRAYERQAIYRTALAEAKSGEKGLWRRGACAITSP